MKDTYSKIKDNYNCPFNLIDDLIGGKWKLRIVAHIINGDNRFSILQKKIDDIVDNLEQFAKGYSNRNDIATENIRYEK